jgi:tRNA pseudouridine38-40 synthase
VHALGQVAHADLTRDWMPYVLRNALNAHIRPHPVSILKVEKTDEDFHARFSATRRHYLYRIVNRRAPPALARDHVWWLPMKLDAAAMHEAAQMLLGRHDFTTFRAASCQAKSPVKTLSRLDVVREGEEIAIRAEARSFLHHQVRSMVGSLKLVGEGKWRPSDLRAALDAKDRARCGPVAPPDGLYLVKVDYPPMSVNNP